MKFTKTLAIEDKFEKRGIEFEKKPASHMGSPIYSATFRTPHGVAVDLWGMVGMALIIAGVVVLNLFSNSTMA